MSGFFSACFVACVRNIQIVMLSADLSSSKQRPALVISADALNSTRDDVLVAAITSQVPTTLAADEFMIPAGELTACGLPKPSILRLSKLVALPRQVVVKRIGALPAPTVA